MSLLQHHMLLSLAIATSASITVAGHARGYPYLVYVFKPLTTALLILLAATGDFRLLPKYVVAIVCGLFLSLLGDVFLMLPSDHFRSGLFSFLLAHACYLLAFTSDNPFATPLLPFLLFLAIGCSILPALWSRIPPRLRLPVVVYVVLLLVMAGQATGRALHLHTASALRASLGAALFVLSDSLLAWNRFHTQFRAAPALVNATYFLAQWLIATSTYAAWPVA